MSNTTTTTKKNTKSTPEVAGRFIASQLKASPKVTRKELGERAERGNPIGEETLSTKDIVAGKLVGRKMPGNRRGHYFAEGFSWLYDNRDGVAAQLVANLPLEAVTHGARTTFQIVRPEPEAPAADVVEADEEAPAEVVEA